MALKLLYISTLLAYLALELHAVRGQGNEVPARVSRDVLLKRATPDAPNGYTPAQVECPSNLPVIRNATLSTEEVKWLSKRGSSALDAMKSFLDRVNLGDDFDATKFLDEISQGDSGAVPTLGIAVSGGGYRALMHGAGVLDAFDDRSEGSTDVRKGGVGGLLQSAIYLSGLSGGSWLLGSMYAQNFSSVGSILLGDATAGIWEFDQTIAEGPRTVGKIEYYDELMDTVQEKEDAGYSTTITDPWGRSLSYQLIDPVTGGSSYTMSSIAKDFSFTSGNTPLPIIVVLERAPNQLNVTSESTVVEFNPWEMGSYDTSMSAYATLQYIGSSFSAEAISQGSKATCIRGFDNLGFIMGTSSSLFNAALLQSQKSDNDGRLNNWLEGKLEKIGNENRDVARWPNPFKGHRDGPSSGEDILNLVDGGMALENIPMHPLLWKERGVDTIIAVDGSADVNGWPNGTALVATYQRCLAVDNEGSLPFPEIPSQNTFVNKGLNNRPTFFGCPSHHSNKDVEEGAPLIIYLPNAPYITLSNVSTFTMSYSDEERDSIIENGRNVANRGQGELDEDWPTCLGCAILFRSLESSGKPIPSKCGDCYERYCWDGEIDDTEPEHPYEPVMALSQGRRVGAEWRWAWTVAGISIILAYAV